MEEAFRMGKIKALGVSNFHPPDLHKLLQISTITPDVVQGWFDPTHPEFETRQVREKGGKGRGGGGRGEREVILTCEKL